MIMGLLPKIMTMKLLPMKLSPMTMIHEKEAITYDYDYKTVANDNDS